jgi:hypothetical protein
MLQKSFSEDHKNIFEPTLDICAKIIKSRFSDKLFKIINVIEANLKEMNFKNIIRNNKFKKQNIT